MVDICLQMAKSMKKVVKKTVEEAFFLVSVTLLLSSLLFSTLQFIPIPHEERIQRIAYCPDKRILQGHAGTYSIYPPPAKFLLSSGQYVNVGEWVEVEHSYVVGTCSDGGVAVVLKFALTLADVRCECVDIIFE